MADDREKTQEAQPATQQQTQQDQPETSTSGNNTEQPQEQQQQQQQPPQVSIQEPEKPQETGEHHGSTSSTQVEDQAPKTSADRPRGSFQGDHPIRASDNIQYLNDKEINDFLDDLDHNDDGYIDYSEVEQKLDQTHDELTPKSGGKLLGTHQPAAKKTEHDSEDDRARHAFLRNMMGSDARRIPRAEFAEMVREWKIPSLKQAQSEEEEEKNYLKRLPGWRKIRAYWSVHGPEIVFLGIVVGMQLAFGIWQLHKYLTGPYTDGFGWGVVLAKTCAGASYPTWFFLVLSMSRYFSTWWRRSYHVSRLFNWDLSQEFHIRISIVALVLATLHVIGHLSGSFVAGSSSSRQDAVAELLGDKLMRSPMRYIDFVRSRPGVTGIPGLALFYILALLSMPQVRRWNYQVFQLGHLLMFPIIGLMMAHGTAALLQWPMFGYFLALPTLLVLVERVVRICLGFHHIKARLKVLDDDTVEISAMIPSERLWTYKAGQYIFLQVPKLSFFQWHPFTVSFCRDNHMMVHIKTDGDWTGRLRELGGESGESEIEVGINGPFGAPAQRFYDFSHSVIIGAGIGVTPFSGILADMQYNDDIDHGGPSSSSSPGAGTQEKSADAAAAETTTTAATNGAGAEKEKTNGAAATNGNGTTNGHGSHLEPPNRQDQITPDLLSGERAPQPGEAHSFADDYRRVDFHWMVRDRNYLAWFSDLLNEVSRSQEWHREHEANPHLDIRIHTHVTAKRKSIVTHVYRWLLEMHRTAEHPASPLTGLLNPTHYGRPDFDRILDEHYEEMRRFRASKRVRGSVGSPEEAARQANGGAPGKEGEPRFKEDEELKVGVFYCGAPVVGEILADKCRELTTRGRHDGSKIEYHFMIEVFG